MSQYLLDTNILLRSVNTSSDQHSLATDSVYQLLQDGNECLLTPQILIEFWVVATRPVEVNGLGWTAPTTQERISQFLAQFTLLAETPEIFTHWFQLVTIHKIKGKRTHDIRLLAVMKANKITHLLTFNPEDFLAISGITIVHPQEIMTNS
jgi:predicted nucleic acid-binding protein